MTDRVQLNEQDLENVVGGAFNFFSRNGVHYCYVDDFGKSYYCSDTAFQSIVEKTSDPTLSVEEVVQWALDEGIFWTSKK